MVRTCDKLGQCPAGCTACDVHLASVLNFAVTPALFEEGDPWLANPYQSESDANQQLLDNCRAVSILVVQ